MHTDSEQMNVHNAVPEVQVTQYFDACRQRIPGFVSTYFSGTGAIHLNRLAWGTDILIAPFNFFMGFPNFIIRLMAVVLEYFGARKSSRWLHQCHLGLPTTVQKRVQTRLMVDLLDLPVNKDAVTDQLRYLVRSAAREPVGIYLQTRNVAADITAGTLAAVVGLLFLSQFTPGSISAGSAIARVIAREQAISEFILGEVIARLYYAVFPVNPSGTVILMTLLVVMATVAIVAAFSGIIHDPIQASTGIHSRRLNKLLDSIEESINQADGKGYRPKDMFLGRAYDMVDWIKGLLSF